MVVRQITHKTKKQVWKEAKEIRDAMKKKQKIPSKIKIRVAIGLAEEEEEEEGGGEDRQRQHGGDNWQLQRKRDDVDEGSAQELVSNLQWEEREIIRY